MPLPRTDVDWLRRVLTTELGGRLPVRHSHQHWSVDTGQCCATLGVWWTLTLCWPHWHIHWPCVTRDDDLQWCCDSGPLLLQSDNNYFTMTILNPTRALPGHRNMLLDLLVCGYRSLCKINAEDSQHFYQQWPTFNNETLDQFNKFSLQPAARTINNRTWCWYCSSMMKENGAFCYVWYVEIGTSELWIVSVRQ